MYVNYSISTKGKTALDILDMMSNDNTDQVVLEYQHPSSGIIEKNNI